MKQVSLALLALTVCGSALADCGGYPVITTTKEDGTRVGVIVTDAQFKKSPAWSPGKGEPPLSISRVVEIAQKWAASQFKRYDSVQIQGINLSEYGCPSTTKHWYYVVHFAPVIDGNRVFSGGQFAVILMDGTIVGPTVVKDAF